MFRRRKKTTRFKQLADFFWPAIGFRRSSKYVGYRLARLKGSPYSLAAGFAFGAAVSFTPLVGLHFIISGVLAWIFRASILASALGTAVGNPWTFPFIWTLTYKVGRWMLGGEPGDKAFPDASLTTFFDGLWAGHWSEVSHIFFDVIHPMLISSLPIAIFVWIIFFYPLQALIRRFQDKRAQIITKARTRRANRRIADRDKLGVSEK
ncbi:DUF2062 domain-containing protein [Sneathiella chungangensis]|uniref:DUF2062 domain-containing protein n=1 Tax=Sneathiella chungangensis TaxID=1418234 RepID=A0A845MD01_9PROT|nr:DUF2062 domain-containing protein [Sneathiella chungangensis]MZR21220.1 DUF2062 domain-containing protein [Sneathiella chungangensis]